MVRPGRVCHDPGCPYLLPCPDHSRGSETARPRSVSDGWYGTQEWRRRSASFLAKHRDCERCGQRATEADHEPERKVLIAMGVADPDDEQYLHPMCKPCHSRKTLTQTNARRLGRDPSQSTPSPVPGGILQSQKDDEYIRAQKLGVGSLEVAK